MIRELSNSNTSTLQRHDTEQLHEEELERKLDQHYQQNKAYIDRTVAEFKAIVKDMARSQTQNNVKESRDFRDNSLSLSRSHQQLTNHSHHHHSHKKMNVAAREMHQDVSIDMQARTPHHEGTPKSITNGTSRVSYLR